jgi:hypothetical protein
MASKTQLRLGQITGSLGDFEGGIIDTRSASAAGSIDAITLNSGSLAGVFSEVASSILRIHGADTFASNAISVLKDINGDTRISYADGADTILNNDDASITLTVGSNIEAAGTFVPDSDEGQDLGTSSLHWGTLHVGQVDATGLTGSIAGTGITNDQVVVSNNGTLEGDTNFTWNGTLLTLGGASQGTSQLSVSGDATITGDLTVNGTTTTLDTTNLLVEDVVIGMAANAASQNQNGGLAIFSGSSDSDLVIGRVANDTWGVGKKATLKGTVTTLADMTLVPLRADKFEVAGATNYIEVAGSTLSAIAASEFEVQSGGDIVLDADSNVVRIKDGGTERGILTQDAALGFVLSSSAGTNLALDSNSGTVIFSQEGGAGGTSVTAMELGANTVNFGLSGESGITEGFIQFNNSGAQVISGSTGLKLDAGANSAALQLKSDNANTFSFKAPGALGGSYTVLMPGNGNIAVGKVLKVNNNLGGGEWGLDWASESVASYEKGAKVIAGGVVNAGTGVDFSAVDHGDAPTSLQVAYANADVFVNGQLLLSGTEANRAGGTVDYTVSGAQELKFAFNLENDDIVSVFVRG